MTFSRAIDLEHGRRTCCMDKGRWFLIVQKHRRRASGALSLHELSSTVACMKHLADVCSGPRCIWNGFVEYLIARRCLAGPNAPASLISPHLQHHQGLRRGDEGRKSRNYSLTPTPSGVRPTRSAWAMETRHDGSRVICASRRRWLVAPTAFVSKLTIMNATKAAGSNLSFMKGVAQSRD